MKTINLIWVILFSIAVVACGGGSRGSSSDASTTGNPNTVGAPTAPAITVVGSQLGGARQGVVPTVTGIVSNYAGAGVIGS